MEADYRRILGILKEQLRAAVERGVVAATRFDEVTENSSLGPPHFENTERIANASRDYIQALRGVSRAIQRITDYQIHQIVPDEVNRRLGVVLVLGALAFTEEQLGPWCLMLVGIPVGY